MSPDTLGWIATVIVLYGTWRVTKKETSGWLLRIVGDALWVVVGLMTGITSIIACEGTFVVLNTIGYLKWRKDEDKQRKS